MELIGKNSVIEPILKFFSNGSVRHAYIISGSAGVGKYTVGKFFSGLLLCKNIKNDQSCCECDSCKMNISGEHPDFYEISHKNNSISVDEIRNLQDNIMIKPYISNRKVYLIKDADRMTIQAQNCFLKMLEEPPDYVTIILTVSNAYAMLDTVRSRVVFLKVKNASLDEIKAFLIKNYSDSKINLNFITNYSEGIIGRAIDLINDNQKNEIREEIFDYFKIIYILNQEAMIKLVKTIENNKGLETFVFELLIFIYRDILLQKTTNNQKMLINSDKKDIIDNCSRRLSIRNIITSIDIIEATRKYITSNVNMPNAFQSMLIRLQEEFK